MTQQKREKAEWMNQLLTNTVKDINFFTIRPRITFITAQKLHLF